MDFFKETEMEGPVESDDQASYDSTNAFDVFSHGIRFKSNQKQAGASKAAELDPGQEEPH